MTTYLRATRQIIYLYASIIVLVKENPVFHLGIKNRKIAYGLKVTGFVLFAIVLITVFIFAGLILGLAGGPVIEILTMSGMVFPALMIVAKLHKKWGFGEFEIYPKDYVP